MNDDRTDRSRGAADGEYLAPYRAAVDQHGGSFEATLWGSRDSQILRFDVMEDLVGFADCSLLDVGCGQGDLAARLHERGVPFRAYRGLDAMEAMIEAARDRGLPRSTFVVADAVADPAVLAAGSPDWVCLSGTLNTMSDAVARTLVGASFEVARRGVVFNCLGDRPHARWTGRDLGPARRFSVAGWLEWALERTRRVAMDQRYLDGHDVTFVLRREEGVGG